MKFSIRERFKFIYKTYLIEELNVNDDEISEAMQTTKEHLQSVIKDKSFLSVDEIARFLMEYDKIDAEWLIIGCGHMMKEERRKGNNITTVNNTHSNNSNSNTMENSHLINQQKDSYESIIKSKDELITYKDVVISHLKEEIKNLKSSIENLTRNQTRELNKQ